MTAIKHKQYQVIYTYQLTSKQILYWCMCKEMLFYEVWLLKLQFLSFCFFSLYVDGIVHLFELCGWTIQEQQHFWRKTQFVVKLVTKNFHQTLQSQHTILCFFWNRHQKWLSLIGCKTSVLEFDKNIYVTFSTESFLFLFLSRIFYYSKHQLWSSFDEGHLISTSQDTKLSMLVMIESSDAPRKE